MPDASTQLIRPTCRFSTHAHRLLGIFGILAALVIFGFGLTACEQPTDKNVETRKNVAEGNRKLKELRNIEKDLQAQTIFLDDPRWDAVSQVQIESSFSRTQVAQVKKKLEAYIALSEELAKIASRDDITFSGKEKLERTVKRAKEYLALSTARIEAEE